MVLYLLIRMYGKWVKSCLYEDLVIFIKIGNVWFLVNIWRIFSKVWNMLGY